MGSSKIRIDELLVAKGLATSRSQAKALVMAGRVFIGTERLDKAGKEVPADTALRVEAPPRFVGRGGEKLAGALERFQISARGCHVLDVGASTGGFTDCVLQDGALSVVCVDVGRAQLHGKLLADPRVTNLEQVNARHLKAAQLPRPDFDLVVMDLSFISLRSVLPAVWPLVRPGGHLIALVKPQFEAGKEEADRGRGVIRDPEVHRQVIEGIREFALTQLARCELVGEMDSPLLGADGNREFLLGLRRAI